MAEKFSQPNYNLTYTDPSLKGFGASKAFHISTNHFTKPFGFIKGFQMLKDFKTNSYSAPNYWSGNFKFKTSDANINPRSPLTSLIRLFKTKSAETKTAWMTGKAYGSREAPQVAETKHAIFPGKIQKKIDQRGAAALTGPNPLAGADEVKQVHAAIKAGGEAHVSDDFGGLQVMTVDDVRALLDKTK